MDYVNINNLIEEINAKQDILQREIHDNDMPYSSVFMHGQHYGLYQLKALLRELRDLNCECEYLNPCVPCIAAGHHAIDEYNHVCERC